MSAVYVVVGYIYFIEITYGFDNREPESCGLCIARSVIETIEDERSIERTIVGRIFYRKSTIRNAQIQGVALRGMNESILKQIGQQCDCQGLVHFDDQVALFLHFYLYAAVGVDLCIVGQVALGQFIDIDWISL